MKRLELLCALLLGAIGWSARPQPVKPFEVQIALLGARETPDGSWSGVDLLANPEQPVDRLQLHLSPARAVWVTLEEITPGGAVVLQRARVETPTVFPSLHGFYEVRERARLRLTVAPLGQPASAAPAPSLLAGARRSFSLSDGSRFSVVERSLRVERPAHLELRAETR
jgi:hypothetical protein